MLLNFVEDVKYGFWSLKCNIKSIICNIKNIFYYLPVIWKDRYWDYEFILVLLKHKLERDKEHFKANNIVEDTSLIYNQIDEVINYIDKYLNPDDAFINERPDLANKFADYEPFSNEFNEYCKEWFELKTDLQQKNWEKIWECISKYGQGWWD